MATWWQVVWTNNIVTLTLHWNKKKSDVLFKFYWLSIWKFHRFLRICIEIFLGWNRISLKFCFSLCVCIIENSINSFYKSNLVDSHREEVFIRLSLTFVPTSLSIQVVWRWSFCISKFCSQDEEVEVVRMNLRDNEIPPEYRTEFFVKEYPSLYFKVGKTK